MKKNFTILGLIVLLLSHLQSFAQCNCSASVAGSSSSINISNGQTICIISGTQTGNINFNGNATLCVASGATIASGINNFNNNSTINIYGTANFANSVNFGGGAINNYNSLNFGSNPNFNGASTITNFNGATITFGQATTLGNGGSIINYGYISAKADLSSNKGTSFFNVNRLHVEGNFNPAGVVSNYGLVVAKGFINFNDGDKMVNYCRLVAVKGFNNNNKNAENYGMIWVPGVVNSTALIQINSQLKNRGYLRTPQLINNSHIVNAQGSIRIEGNNNSSNNVSVNNGGGTISEGDISDISNISKTPSYSLDVNSGNISAKYGYVAAYDTSSAQYAGDCSPSYFGYSISGTLYNDANGLTDNSIGWTATDKLLPTTPIYASLINSKSGLVSNSLPINATTGEFVFQGVEAGNYAISISTLQGVVGSKGPIVELPGGWVGIGQFLGAGEGSDNNVNDSLVVVVGSANVSSAKFGIQQLPVAQDRSAYINNAAADEKYTLYAPSLSILPLEGSDPEDGELGTGNAFAITSLPANARLFYAGEEITRPAVINPNSNGNFNTFDVQPSFISVYDPTLLQIAFTDQFTGTTTFKYSVMDAAGQYSEPADYTISALTILPITIANLKGNYNSNSNEVLLSWQVLGAQAAMQCAIERSVNGQQFVKVGSLTAAGNGNFQYTDRLANGVGNTFYYRLNVKSLDGEVVYSNIVKLGLNKEQAIFVSPNPTKNNITISGLQAKNTVTIINTQGKVLQQQFTSANILNINLGNYPNGLYYVKVYGQDNTVISVKKIIKQ